MLSSNLQDVYNCWPGNGDKSINSLVRQSKDKQKSTNLTVKLTVRAKCVWKCASEVTADILTGLALIGEGRGVEGRTVSRVNVTWLKINRELLIRVPDHTGLTFFFFWFVSLFHWMYTRMCTDGFTPMQLCPTHILAHRSHRLSASIPKGFNQLSEEDIIAFRIKPMESIPMLHLKWQSA